MVDLLALLPAHVLLMITFMKFQACPNQPLMRRRFRAASSTSGRCTTSRVPLIVNVHAAALKLKCFSRVLMAQMNGRVIHSAPGAHGVVRFVLPMI